MPAIKTFGKVFVTPLRLRRRTPPVHQAHTTEIEWPFRAGPCWIFHVFPTFGIGIGLWKERLEEDSAMMRALNARQEEVFGVDGTLLPSYGRPDDWADEEADDDDY